MPSLLRSEQVALSLRSSGADADLDADIDEADADADDVDADADLHGNVMMMPIKSSTCAILTFVAICFVNTIK